MTSTNLNFSVPGSRYSPADRWLAMMKPAGDEARMPEKQKFDLALVPTIAAVGWSGLWTEVGHTRPPRMHWSLE